MAIAQLGFDIGTGALKIAQCDGGGIRRAVSVPLPDHLVQEGRITSFDAMADLIKETVKKNRLSGKTCAVVLPDGLAYLRRVTMPAMTVEQLAVNLPFEFRDYLTAAKDRYFYDHALNEITNDEEGKPMAMDLTAAAVSKETIREYGEMFRRAGLKLKVAAPVECAYANLLRAYIGGDAGRDKREYCLLDLGHSVTRIHIFTGTCFEVTRTIEIGSAMVDAAVAEAMSVDAYLARSYKESNHQRVLEQDGVKGVYAAIAVEVMKAINFYGFNNRDSNIEEVYCGGGGSRAHAIRETVGTTLGLKIHSISDLLPGFAGEAEVLEVCAAAAGITMQ